MNIAGIAPINHSNLMWWDGKEIIPYEKETHKTKKQDCPGFKTNEIKNNKK